MSVDRAPSSGGRAMILVVERDPHGRRLERYFLDAALQTLYDDGSACTGDLTRDLTSQTVDTKTTLEACRTITAGSGFVVSSTGDVILQAGERIALSDGFSVQAGGRLAVGVDPVLRCQ